MTSQDPRLASTAAAPPVPAQPELRPPVPAPLFLVLIGGLVLTLVVVYLVGRLEERSARADFATLAEQRFTLLDANLARAMDTLVATGALFDAMHDVSRDHFRAFVQPILKRQTALRALEWVPYTNLANLAELRTRVRAQGLGDFEVRELGSDGDLRPVGPRAEYFPVVYVEPMVGNERALGFDMGSNPARYTALDAARREGRMVATARILLVQQQGSEFGVLVFRPIYSGAHPGQPNPLEAVTGQTLLADPGALRGYVLGVFRLEELLGASPGGGARAAVALSVYDEQGRPGEQLLYSHGGKALDPVSALGPNSFQHRVSVGGRSWIVVAQPVDGVLRVDRTATPILLAAGLLLTALVLLLQKQNRARAGDVERLVAERTAGLLESERRLIKANHEAVQASRTKTMFLASMSHEFRTPMNAILGLLHVLGRTPLNPPQREHIDKISSAARRLLRLIDDILDVSRIEAGKLSVERMPFDLEAMLRDVLVAITPKLRDKPVELVLDLDPALPAHLVGDGMRLTQILVNLADNAAKFTSAGEIVLSLAFVPLDRGRIELRVEVRDSGPGMAEAETRTVFQPFVQSETTRQLHPGGTGLGLAICRQLLHLMGGEIALESRPGEGCRFYFSVPLEVESPAVLAAPGERRAPQVLVLDAHPGARASLARMVAGYGGPVTTVATLEECRAWLAGHSCDLLLASKAFDLQALLQDLPKAHRPARHVTLGAPGDSLHVGLLVPAPEKPLLPGPLAKLLFPLAPVSETVPAGPLPIGGAAPIAAGDPSFSRRHREPAADAASARAAVPAELRNLADQLREFLKTGDPQAEDISRAMSRWAEHTPYAAAAGDLLRLSVNFDFREALVSLDALCPADSHLEN